MLSQCRQTGIVPKNRTMTPNHFLTGWLTENSSLRKTVLLALIAATGAVQFASHAAEAVPPMIVHAPIIVPDSKGGFDYLQVDEPLRRLLANHTGNNTILSS